MGSRANTEGSYWWAGVHPNRSILPPNPLKVSPFIRACRWGALVLGIGWGLYRKRAITKQHLVNREKDHDHAMHEAHEVIRNRKVAAREEAIALAEAVGIPDRGAFLAKGADDELKQLFSVG